MQVEMHHNRLSPDSPKLDSPKP